MSFKAILYAYVLGGITFIPLVILAIAFYTIYTSVPVGDLDASKATRGKLERQSEEGNPEKSDEASLAQVAASDTALEVNDSPKSRKGWLTVRRTYEEAPSDGSYVGLVRGFLDGRSKDPKRSRPKDMWYVVLKGKILYLYEDESMTECEAVIQLGVHDVVIYPEGLPDGELFAKRNAICLRPKIPPPEKAMPSVTKEMKFGEDEALTVNESASEKQKERERARIAELEKQREEVREQVLEVSTPWFIFVRSNVEMEDWYHAFIHASDHPASAPTLAPLSAVFHPADMNHLVTTLDEQPDVIPMRWLNALIGRVFFSFYRTQTLESYIIGRLHRKLAKVKRPGFLTHIVVREVSVGNKVPTFSKPMLKELTKEGDASMEVHLQYKGEIRITVEAIATINLGARFKTYAVKLVLAAVLRELEGNLLVKVKRPPSNRLWYAFTTMPRMVLDVEPVVSDRQITWSMILSTIESRLKEVILESVVLPNMDDIAFFESSQYSRRGGIYADASRSEKPPSLFAEPPASAPSEQERTPSSEPVTEISSSHPSTSPESKPILQRSHSAEAQPEPSKLTEPQPGVLDRPATITGATSIMTPNPSTSSSTSKRRSWFQPVQEGSDEDPFGDVYDDGYSRGRRASADPIHRSPSPHEVPASAVPDTDGDTNRHLSPIPIERSSSRRSQSSSPQGVSQPSSVEETSSSAPSESLLTAFNRSRSSSGSASKKDSGASSSSTFFQTLKSRDKQAISNTAKEAMRKWGVNWGGLKKDSVAAANTSDQEVEPKLAPEPRINRPKPSYAEVRAAVEQRRERERGSSEHVAEAENLRPSDSQATLQGLHTRSGSTGSAVSPAEQTSSPANIDGATLSHSTSPRLGPQDTQSDASSRPASPRPRTISRLSNGASDGGSSLSGSLPDEVEHPSDAPLHTRPPQPKTMTIPGIHASHRGEVMSMGYAPPPVPGEPKKAPAIQSITRLWKNASNPSQQGLISSADQNGNSEPLTSTTSPSQLDSASTPPIQPARPIPPPLPPRSNTTHALQTKPETPLASDTDQPTSPASAALQSIASRDRSKRESLGSATGANTPTPSSPRREEVMGNAVSMGVDDVSTAAATSDSGSTFSSTVTPSDTTVEAGTNVPSKPPALPPRRIHASA